VVPASRPYTTTVTGDPDQKPGNTTDLADPVVVLAPSITATLTDDIGLGVKKNPGDTITYTAIINNGGASPADDATGVIFSSILDANTSFVPLSVNAQPIARADSYTASGNIPISLSAPGVLTNDVDPMIGTNTGLTVTEVQGSGANVGAATNTTATGLGAVKGSVTLSVDGSFTYEPPPGYTGTDTFTYKTSEGTLTDTNTVTITISSMVWFIKNTGGGLNRGTFSNPFTTIGSFNTANAVADAAPNPKSGDLIALRSGTYTEADGVNLRNNQKLIGEAVQFSTVFSADGNSSSAYTTFAGGTNTAPTISTSAGNGVDLADSNTVRGLNVGNTLGFFGFKGSAVGSPIINTVNVTGTGGAISVSTSGTFGANVSFGTLESTSSPGANINLVGVTGTMGIISGGTGFTGSAASSNAISVSGGSLSFTYPGNVTKAGLGSLLNVSGGHTGTLTFNTGTLSATAGDGLQFNNADGIYNFNGTTTLNGGDAGVDILTGSGGTFSFGSNASISNPTGTAFNVSASAPTGMTYSGSITANNSRSVSISNPAAAGCGTQSFSGSINGSGASATGIIVNNCNAGTLTFSGTTLTLSTQANNALTLSGNAGATVNFSGGNLALTTTTARGLLASGGGTINVTGLANAISTTNGTAFEVFGTSGVHMGGAYTFRAITADVDGPANTTVANNGIHLQYHDGPFTITGDGVDADSTPDSLTSGGTISGANERGAEFLNVTGAIVLGGMTFTNAAKSQIVAGSVCGLNLNTNNNTTCNAALHFENTSGGVTLNTMLVDGSVQGGINGYTVTNLNMSDVEVRNVGDEVGENGILMKNLVGSGTATSLNLHDNEAKQLNIINTLNNDLTSFTINTSTFSNSSAPNGGQGILLQTYDSGTSMNVTVSNSTFSNLFSNAHQVSTNTGSTETTSITGSTFTNVNAWTVIQASDGGTNSFTLTNNSGTTGVLSGSNAINIKTDNADLAGTPSVATGTISGNTIGSGAVGSGATCGGGCSGIVVAQRDGGTVNVNITGNTIRHTDAQGVQITGGNSYVGNAGKVVATITGNLIKDPDGGVLAAIHVQAGTQSGDTNCLEATVGGTTNPGAWPSTAANAMNRIEGNWDPTTAPTFSAGNEIFIWRRFTSTLNIPGYTGAPFVTARNSFNSADGTSVGTSGTISSGSCPLLLGLGGNVLDENFPLTSFGSTLFSSSSDSALNVFLAPSITSASRLSEASLSEVAPSKVLPLSQEQLELVVSAARQRWIATGLTTRQVARLRGIQFEIADLQGAYLGDTDGNRIQVDRDGGGKGWYVGVDQQSDSLFNHFVTSTRRYAGPATGPAGHVDLLTAIEHEMGHRLGLDDSYAEKDRDNLMYGYLRVGERRLATRGQAGGLQPGGLEGSHFLSVSDHKPLSPLSGETVTVNGAGSGFTLPGGDSVTITFQATVNTPPMARSVQTQGKVSGSNFTLVNGLPTTQPNTNDPETVVAGDATVTNINTTTTWAGGTSSDWHIGTNWTPSFVPSSISDVFIPNAGVTNEPNIISADVNVYSLDLQSARTLTINAGRTLTVNAGQTTLAGALAGGPYSLSLVALTVNRPSGITLNGATSVSGVLTLTSGDVATGANVLSLGSAGSIVRTSGHIIGSLKKMNVTAPFIFPVGTGVGYTPIDITAASGGGDLTVRTVALPQPTLETNNPGKSLKEYWTLTKAGTLTVSMVFHYLQTDVPVTSNEANYRIIRVVGTSTASFPQSCPSTSCADPAANTFTISGVSNFSDWTVGEVLAPTAASGRVTGRIIDDNGAPVEGAVVRLSGAQNRKFITDANGVYHFENVETGGFYNVTPSRVNYSFSPSSISFSQLGESTEAAFGATATGGTDNPLNTPEYFVRQNYIDFLGREPDEAGFNFWSDEILSCGDDADCVDRKRTNVSAAYFLSIEFQQTGGLVDGLYRASYGARPNFAEFRGDAAAVAPGLVVGSDDWQTALESGKGAFADAFVQRPAFQNIYGGLSNDAYVSALIANTGVTFASAERSAFVSSLGGGTSRGAVLRLIVENPSVVAAKRNEAFVMMEYFGYLKREPDAAGFDFWLNKLNQFNGNFEQAEMVKSFIISLEYRQRFPR
jgi:hypothetical protein